MAKKRKASRLPQAPSGPKEYDQADARLGPISTFEDIADEQEEYFLDKDKILFEEERGTKRQRQQQREDEFLDLSDDEVLGDDPDNSDNSDAEEQPGQRRKQKQKAKKAAAKKTKLAAAAAKKGNDDDNNDDDDDDDGGARAADGDEDQGWWGSSKAEYYDGEAIETEAHALEEEEEARKLQKKQLARMKATDFFDADDWAADGAEAAATAAGSTAEAGVRAGGGAGGTAVKMTLKTKEEVDAMTSEERYRYLQDNYPEIDPLCDDFAELEPLLAAYREQAAGKGPDTLEVVQFRVLSCYVATIALYFAILMAPSRDNPAGSKYVMDPDELHDHEVMEYLVTTRDQWAWVKRVQARRRAAAATATATATATAAPARGNAVTPARERAPLSVEDRLQLLGAIPERAGKAIETKPKKAKKAKAETEAAAGAAKAAAATKKQKKDKRPGAVSKAVEESMADLADLIPGKANKAKKAKKAKKAAAEGANDDGDNDSDLGEEEALDARTADEKLKRKKSLGFYTSQIMQKANLRSGAGGQAGGDVDIPYRERLRDRQARLNAAAARRGQSALAPGEELGAGDDDDDDDGDGDAHGKGSDAADLAYYESFVQAHKAKMAAKADRKAGLEAQRLDRVLPAAAADKDGRRQLTWEIEKNKGLSHRTLKEKKNNPRVKKRVKFEKKKKQLASMRAVYKPMNPSDYQGERTGIKTGLVRSIKLD